MAKVYGTDFNSIKVRLEQGDSSQARIYQKFQFHKGTIRTQEVIAETPRAAISIP